MSSNVYLLVMTNYTKSHLPCNNNLKNNKLCVLLIQLLCIHEMLLLHVASYDGPGRYYLKHRCGNRVVSTPEMKHIQSLLDQLQGEGGAAYPMRFLLNFSFFHGAADCLGLQNTSANYGPPVEDTKLVGSSTCAFNLCHITQRMLDEFCWMNAEARYASTECVIDYKYFPDGNLDNSCEIPWPPQLYPEYY